MRVIKRYDNRKLYDTQTSKTVNLGEIAEMIRLGEEVQVVDSSGQDITPKILGQIFLQENVATKQLMFNKFVLQGLIQESKNMEGIIKKFLLGGIGLASLTQEKMEELVNELVQRGELAESQRARFLKDLMSRSAENFHKVKEKVATPGTGSAEDSPKEDRIEALESQIAALQSELKNLKNKKSNA